jgi:hypothetical protein
MLQPHALGGRYGGKGADLIHHCVFDLAGRRRPLAAAEAVAIGKGGVGAHRHAVRTRQRHRDPHGRGIARVESARDVGGRDGRHQRGVPVRNVVATLGCGRGFPP